MRRLLAFGVLVALLAPVAALADCRVHCTSSRIGVEQRDPDQMPNQPGACPMSQGFTARSDAEGFARRNFGGVGGSCSCR